MAGSLQDQLLGFGLVDKKKAKKMGAAKRKQAKKNRKANIETVDEAAVLAEKAIEEEKERSRLLNKEKNKLAERKAVAAQIKQLIVANLVSKVEGELAYNFADDNKIKTLYMTEDLQDAIASGRLAIVKLDDSYELVPRVVASKILDRDEDSVIQINQLDKEQDDKDDPYADYQIPDDLMW